MVRPEQPPRKSLLEQDIAVAAHADLKPISRYFDSGGHEFDEGVLAVAVVSEGQGRGCRCCAPLAAALKVSACAWPTAKNVWCVGKCAV